MDEVCRQRSCTATAAAGSSAWRSSRPTRVRVRSPIDRRRFPWPHLLWGPAGQARCRGCLAPRDRLSGSATGPSCSAGEGRRGRCPRHHSTWNRSRATWRQNCGRRGEPRCSRCHRARYCRLAHRRSRFRSRAAARRSEPVRRRRCSCHHCPWGQGRRPHSGPPLPVATA
jgi:hypothetical protein